MPGKIFLLYGEEEFLIKEKLEEISKGFSANSFNLEVIDAEKLDQERIVAALQTSPLLGGGKLVIVKNADLSVSEWGELLPALKALPDSVVLVICADAVDKRTGTYRFLDEKGEVYELRSFAPWEQDELVSWIVRRVSRLGKKIDYEAALRLKEICGNSLLKLDSEIEKLVTFAGEGEKITREDVMTLASPGEIDAFALSDAVANKDLCRALSAFQRLYRNRKDLFQILPLLATQYRTLLHIKSLAGGKADAAKIARLSGTSPYFVRKCLEKIHFFREDELVRNLELLLEADLKLKSGEPQSSTFELLLTALCGK